MKPPAIGSKNPLVSKAACVPLNVAVGSQVMPLLREILTQANDKTHNMMRAKALECISLIGMSIGRDRFRTDAHQVLQYMQSLQVSSYTP